MRAFSVFAFLLAFGLAASGSVEKSSGKLVFSYDKFKDATSMTMKFSLRQPRLDARSLTMMATHTYSGTQFKRPEKILISFFSDAKDWIFLDDSQRSFIALTEAKRVNYGTMQRLGSQIERRAVFELVGLWITPESFLELANAKTAEIQLGETVYKLKPEDLAAFREFAVKTEITKQAESN
jgi:hypothetical protein